MAQSVRDVEDFLLALVDMFKPLAEKEFEKLCHFAGKMVKPWDIAYYAERLRLKELKFTQEMLRPYFPLSEVLRGMFEVAERLFGVSFVKRNDVERYHPQVDLYEIEDLDGSPRGAILFDLHARRGKRGHAWVEPLVGRNGLGGLTVLPLASLVCNFGPNDPGSDTKLTHNEVVTLFHEFGHALHHCLTTVDYPSVAGFNAVPWDIIELPSQLFENYAWQDEVLSSISASSGAGALPRELMKRIAESRKFHAGLQALRQLEIALFDLTIHTATSQDYSSVLADLAQVRCRTAIVPYCDEDRFPNSFLHVFAGSYAAGYYSYKWAEVLASDVFAAFIENGIFDRETATRFSETILTKGGSRPPLGAFVEFRGRMPSLQALLEQAGMQFTPVT
jgi:oligopeptidase A